MKADDKKSRWLLSHIVDIRRWLADKLRASYRDGVISRWHADDRPPARFNQCDGMIDRR